jgi:carboxyl-terminal processing protease
MLRYKRVIALVALLSVVAIPAITLTAQDLEPRPIDRKLAGVVTRIMGSYHLTGHPLDDEISERTLTSFLKYLDPAKVYFYQPDVDTIFRFRHRVDDLLREHDPRLAYGIFNRYLKRVDERVGLADELLKLPFDFSVDETYVTDPDTAQYPADEAAARERWRKKIKYELLSLRADDVKPDEATKRLGRRYHNFQKRMHELDADELMEMFLNSFTSSYDPHTNFFSPRSHENFTIRMKLNYHGIGAILSEEDGYTVVKRIIPGGAAARDGRLKPEDKIIGVAQGKNGEMVDAVNMKLNDLIELIRGPLDSLVRLRVQPAAGGASRTYDITRARIELKDSEAHGEVFSDLKKPDGTPLRIGVIDLPGFYVDMEAARKGEANYKSSTRDVRRILNDFRTRKVDAVVLDLRHNGGGSLSEAVSLTGLFIDRGTVVQVKDSDGEVRRHDDPEPGMAWKGPLVVLTSRFSASASEILAGAIQDYGRGLIVGDPTTAGKGTVQNMLDLGARFASRGDAPNLGAIKLTIQQFYRPDGLSTQRRGVLADLELPSLTTWMDVGENHLPYALDFNDIPAARHETTQQANGEIIRNLTEASAARRKASPDFQKLEKQIAAYRKIKDRKTMPLEEKKYRQMRDALQADEKDKEAAGDRLTKEDRGIERDFYLNEVLAVTRDYVTALNGGRVAVRR